MNWQKMKPWVLNLEVVGLVIAILIAYWHSREIRDTAAALKTAETSLTGKIDDAKSTMLLLQKSMSTRSLGSFPAFTDEIEATIKSAKHDVVIASDFAAYGEFDGVGLPIRQAIEKKIQTRIPVHLTLLCAARREISRSAQFPSSRWNSWMTPGSTARGTMLRYLRNHGGNSAAPTYENFMGTLENFDQAVSQRLFQGADIKETNSDMPLLFWIADGERAVMVVQSYGGNEESAFWTADPRLITALQSIAARYRQFCPPKQESTISIASSALPAQVV
ncbi:MAG TPA: hypothetical protein VM715_14850, partial [Candidatus Acidoferrum sp.]|nr:hypothetical protein [Candidatus Acidoferrum sp.]